MKNLIFMIVLISLCTGLHAQSTAGKKTMSWTIGIKPSVPIGHFSDYSGFGLGGIIQGEVKPGRVGITLNAAYQDYFGKNVNGSKYADFKYVPVLAGIKYYTSSSAFLHGQLGPGFGLDGLGTNFWYGAGFGLILGRSVEAELGYMGWKQHLITNSTNGGGYGGNGGTGGTGGTGGYGGHYSTIDLTIGFRF
ncbi:MAG TPA: hypothetical protein VNS32_14660 [Flavisolibacter sp.]|nr:hypothetical protein [Flavisolibacter sp.]